MKLIIYNQMQDFKGHRMLVITAKQMEQMHAVNQ